MTESREMKSRDKIRPLKKSDYEALAQVRAALRRFLKFSEEAARACGLTAQQHQVLLAIKGRPKRDWATVAEIAEALQVQHHAAVGLVDRCVRGGWAQRTPDPDDRRQKRVSLTSSGEQILEGLTHRNRRELKKLQDALDVLLLEE
jgi:DNA-binding MarR family transcriptional regulator